MSLEELQIGNRVIKIHCSIGRLFKITEEEERKVIEARMKRRKQEIMKEKGKIRRKITRDLKKINMYDNELVKEMTQKRFDKYLDMIDESNK